MTKQDNVRTVEQTFLFFGERWISLGFSSVQQRQGMILRVFFFPV